VLEDLEKRYGVDDANCSYSEKSKNPYVLSSIGIKNSDLNSNQSGRTGNNSDFNQLLMPNDYP
jgi:hypothetical protein